MDGPDFAGTSVFVGHQLPALQPVAPPVTQSEIFSDRPQRQRRLPVRYRDGANDAEIAGNDDSADLSDRQNLRALRASLTVAIHKIDKYVAALEDSPAYWAAMILHPGLKKRWIEKHLSEEHAQRIIQGFKGNDAQCQGHAGCGNFPGSAVRCNGSKILAGSQPGTPGNLDFWPGVT